MAADVCDKRIDAERLDEAAMGRLFDELRDKALYLCSRFKTVRDVLDKGCDSFLALTKSEKRLLLVGLIEFYAGKKQRVSLSLIGGSPNAGKITNSFLHAK